MSKNTNGKRWMIVLLQTIAVPVLVWVILEIFLRYTSGIDLIADSADVKTLFRNLISSMAFALAIGTNLNSGRMDLSLGSQMYVGIIVGGNIALNMGWGGIGILICSALVGGICGLIMGLLFIKLRILPMILGLGMTLVFECICFPVNNQQGIVLFGAAGIDVLSDIRFIIFIAILIIAIVTYLFQFSTYGYKYRAIQGSQKLASDAGINIFSNCVFCYVLAGVLVACAGVFIIAYKGNLQPVLGMNSNSYVFSNFFAMILGVWIGSFCNNGQIGVLMASVSVNLLIIFLAKIGIGTNQQNVILYTILLLFTVYNANKHKIAERKAYKKRIIEAKQFIAAN